MCWPRLGSRGWSCGDTLHGDVTHISHLHQGPTPKLQISPVSSLNASNAYWAPQFCSRVVKTMLPKRENVWLRYVSFRRILPGYEAIRHTPACALTSPRQTTPIRAATQARKIAGRGRGRSFGRGTDSSQQLQRKDGSISHLDTIRSN